MSVKASFTAAAFVLCCVIPASAQSIKLEFQDGRVNLSTQNASLRQILTEWSRLGGTKVINGERVAGGPLTLELTGVTERQALDVLLRSVAGYMLGPRADGSTARSEFDSILIVPTSSAPRTAPAVSSPPPRSPFIVRTPVEPFVPEEQDAEENPPDDVAPDEPEEDLPVRRPRRVPRELIPPGANGENTPPPPFQPEPEGAEPEDESAEPAPPSNPFGVQPGSARPGTITPVPQQQRPQNERPEIGEEP